jgi:CheY-like chemotaxis protein
MAVKVLVIDDDEAIGESLSMLLRRKGYEVLLATDGKAGLALFEAHRPALVITDMVMPGDQGFDTVAAIKRAKPDARIIAMSGSRIGLGGGLDRAAAAGADVCLEKPFEAADLFGALERLLGDSKES